MERVPLKLWLFTLRFDFCAQRRKRETQRPQNCLHIISVLGDILIIVRRNIVKKCEDKIYQSSSTIRGKSKFALSSHSSLSLFLFVPLFFHLSLLISFSLSLLYILQSQCAPLIIEMLSKVKLLYALYFLVRRLYFPFLSFPAFISPKYLSRF